MRRAARWLAGVIAALAAVVIALRLIFPLPSLDGRVDSTAIPASAETGLGAHLLAEAAAHPGLSGVRALVDAHEAFAMRIALARAAETSIDAQYYIWQEDATGYLLLDELRQAAERGVRVRLLLDDNGITGLDEELAALDAMDGVEVRLWNPFTLRAPKVLGYLFDFPRLNRRMHNKSFTVDGVATILGGRNIGDVYFAYGDGASYVDMDALAVGPAAAATAGVFDAYWASGSSYPAALILPPAPGGLDLLIAGARAAQTDPVTTAYAQAAMATPLMEAMRTHADLVEWVPATVIADDPAKGLGLAGRDGMLLTSLLEAVGEPQASVDIVSAYFVPGPEGSGALAAMEARGVAVRTLTNAWEATDVPLVHAGYARWRRALLDAGVEMFELRAESAGPAAAATQGLTTSGSFGISAASLHAKTMVFDRVRIFVGSFNFDPRSGRLNTEMGLLIDSPAIAESVAAMMDRVAPDGAYRVETGADGALSWVAGAEGAADSVLAPEPGTTPLSRLGLRAVSLLPIEWLL